MSTVNVKPTNGSGPDLERVPASMAVFTDSMSLLSKTCSLAVEREQDKTRIVVEALGALVPKHGFVLTKEATRDLIKLLQASL